MRCVQSFAVAALAAVLAAGLALTAEAQSSAGQAYGLHPVCGSIQRSSVTRATTVLTENNSTELEVSCFSYSLMPVSGSDTAACAEAPHRVILDIDNPAAPGQGQSVDWTTLYAGSMYATAFRFDTTRTFRLYLDYPSFAQCPKTMYISMYAELTVRRRTDVEHPYVVSAQPIVMYRSDTYTVQLRNPAPVPTASRPDIMAVLIHATKSCSRDAQAEYALAGSGHNLPLQWINATDALWPVRANGNGGFAICIKASPQDSWSVAAFVEAYGGSPAFFDSDEVTSMRTRRSITYDMVFFGHNLNALTDSLVLVHGSDHTCGTAPRASSSVTVSALSQRSTNTTTARVTFRQNTLYLVCYRHAGASEYVDVPNFDTMSRHVIENVTDPDQQRTNHNGGSWANGVTPAAPGSSSDDPAQQWLSSCATAPVQPSFDRVTTDELVRLIVASSSVPGDLTSSIASVLCLPGARNVSIAQVSASSAFRSGIDVIVGINCPSNVCNSPERQQALITAVQSGRFAGVIVSADAFPFEGVNVRAASDDDGDDGGASDTLYIVVGVLIALVIALLVAVVLVFRHRGRNAAAAARTAHPEANVVQGHVIEVQGAPADRGGDNGTGANPYGNGSTYVEPVSRDEDTAPIPPPPQKPAASASGPHYAAEPAAEDADDRELQ